MVSVCVAEPTSPAALVTVTTACQVARPTPEAVAFQLPTGCTNAVSVWPATVTVMVLPGVALVLPRRVGLVLLLVAIAPQVIVTTGATVLTFSVWKAQAWLPVPSETVMTTRCWPSARCAEVTDHVPSN